MISKLFKRISEVFKVDRLMSQNAVRVKVINTATYVTFNKIEAISTAQDD